MRWNKKDYIINIRLVKDWSNEDQCLKYEPQYFKNSFKLVGEYNRKTGFERRLSSPQEGILFHSNKLLIIFNDSDIETN